MDKDDSWDDTQSTIYEIQQKTPRNLLRVITLLKSLKISGVNATFSFATDRDKQKFEAFLNKEISLQDSTAQNNLGQDYRRQQKVKENLTHLKQKKGVAYLQIDSFLKTDIYMEAYHEKLNKLELQNHVKIVQLGKNISITSDQSISPILKAKLTQMQNRLKVFVKYDCPSFYEVMMSSKYLETKMKEMGIFYHKKYNRRNDVAFYSMELSYEDIKKNVLKILSLTPKVIMLQDLEIPIYQNQIIFGQLTSSIKKTIDDLRQIYEVLLEINPQRSCFILHSKHQVFAEEPIQQLSNVITNLIFISLKVNNSRQYSNMFKRHAEKTKFIQVRHDRRRLYCCIDRSKIVDKKEVMFVFKNFLEEINRNSQLTIHLKANNVLQKYEGLTKQILDLVDEYKLEVQNYEAVFQKKSNNITVRPKNFNKDSNKSRIQLQLSNFLLKLLMLEEKQQIITEEEMNDELVLGKQDHKESTIISTELQQQIKMKVEENQNNIEPKVEFEMVKPNNIEDQVFSQGKRVADLQQFLYDQETIQFRVWNLNVCFSKFGIDERTELVTSFGFIVSQITNGKQEAIANPPIISLSSLKAGETGYLVYFDEKKEKYLPTHILKKN